MQGSALEGVRVIDLCERIGGAYCGLLFATYGAEVILVEPPKGNALRRRGARVEGQGGRGESVSALWYLQGRKSVQFDLESEAGRREFRDLVKSADIILESFLPGKMEQLGLGMETLKGWKPDIVLLSLTDFGQTGPYRAFQAEEATIEALSGQMFGTGSPEREPLSSGPPIAQMTGGLHGFLGGQLALRLRNADGCARHVDVSHHEAGVENMELRAYAQWTAKGNPTREEFAHSALVPWGIYPCQDGWAAMHGAPFRRWRSFGRLLRGGNLLVWLYERGVEKMEQSESAKAGSLSGRNKKLRQLFLRYLDRATHQWTKERSRAEILQVGRERGLAFGSLRRLDEVLSLPQHRARDFFQEVTHPTSGRYEACRALFPMEGLQAMRVPVPGEHQDLLASLSTDEEVEAEPLSEPKPKGALPLEGIRVLDLTVVEAAPHGARVLADYGAEVLLVEYPGRLDLFRGTSLQRESYNRQPFWSQLHRNKRSLTLDLKSAKGREALLDLVETADVVLTSFRSGTLERLHLGYEEL
ncbi:MAG: CoA transferase, partial [Verrucomicrobiota bacterium]